MTPRIHITGASGSGTTTLGRALARELGVPHLDSDAYYWRPTDPPFTLKRDPEERIALLKPDLERPGGWVLSGSLCGWGDFAIPAFDLVIFLTATAGARIARLTRREAATFGDAILPGGSMYEVHREFIAWASRYDSAGTGQRSRALHEEWLATLRVPVLRLDGEAPVAELVRSTIEKIRTHERERGI